MKEYKYKINGKEYTVKINECDNQNAKVEVNGKSYDVEIEKQEIKEVKPVAAPKAAARPAASKPAPQPAAPAASAAAAPGSGKALKAPLPGVITEIKATVGQAVKKGDTVVVLEAMKMQNNIGAECDGTITAICVNKGDSVLEGAVLLTIG